MLVTAAESLIGPTGASRSPAPKERVWPRSLQGRRSGLNRVRPDQPRVNLTALRTVKFLPASSCFPKVAHTCYVLLHGGYVSCSVLATFPATYRLRFLLRISYVSAIKRPGQPPSGIREGGWPTFALLTMVRPEPSPARSTPGEPGRAADRQAFASLSYPTNRQVLRYPHVGRPGFLVSMSIHPRTAVRRGRHAGLLVIPNCQRLFARSRHT